MRYVRLLPLLALTWLLPGAAHASCKSPFQVLWSYPAQGAVVAPGSALSVLVPWLGKSVTAQVGGVALQELPSNIKLLHHFALPALTGNAIVALHLWGIGMTPAEADATLAFTVAGALDATPTAPVVTGYTAVVGPLEPSDPCRDILFQQDCFDTGQDTWYRWQIAAQPGVVAWVVRPASTAPTPYGKVTPGACGPGFFSYKLAPGTCWEIRGVGQTGVLTAATKWCSPTANPQADAGCAAGPRGSSSALALLLGLLGLLAIRRRTPLS